MGDRPADSTNRTATAADPLLAAVGKRIMRVRLAKDIGVTEAALAANMNKGHWWRIEAGEHNVSVKILARVAAALATDLSDLLAGVFVPPARSAHHPDAQPEGDGPGRTGTRDLAEEVGPAGKRSTAAQPASRRSTGRKREGPPEPG